MLSEIFLSYGDFISIIPSKEIFDKMIDIRSQIATRNLFGIANLLKKNGKESSILCKSFYYNDFSKEYYHFNLINCLK